MDGYQCVSPWPMVMSHNSFHERSSWGAFSGASAASLTSLLS